MTGFRYHNAPGADARRAQAYARASWEDKFPGVKYTPARKVKTVQEGSWGKKGLLPEMPSMKRKRYEREIAERKKDIANLEAGIKLWRDDIREAAEKNRQANETANREAAEIRADTENGWSAEEKERRITQVKYVYVDAAEAQRQQTQIAKQNIAMAEKDIAELQRKVAQHEQWLAGHGGKA